MRVAVQTAFDRIRTRLGRCVVKSHLDGETIGFTSEQAADRSLSVLKTKGTLTLGGTPFDGHEDVALPAVPVRPDPAQPGEYMTFFFPPGYIWESLSPTNPYEYLGYGVWEPFGQGRMTVGVDPDDPDFEDSDMTSGEKKHTLLTEEMPAHTHDVPSIWLVGATGTPNTGGNNKMNSGTRTSNSVGGGKPHNNMPPYITVYRFVRVDGL